VSEEVKEERKEAATLEEVASSSAKEQVSKDGPQKSGTVVATVTATTIITESQQLNLSPPAKKGKLTNRDVFYILAVYLALPLFVLLVTSQVHEHLHVVLPSDAGKKPKNITTTNMFIMEYLRASNLLLLGFPSSQTLWSTIYERVLSVLCWGLSFLFIRKGCNPESPVHFVANYWRGAVLSSLMILYSTFGRAVFQQTAFWRGRQEEEPRSPFWDACLVGISWGISSLLVRRRLDPALRQNLLQRCWKDIICGSLSLATGAYLKSQYAPLLFLPLQTFLQETFPVSSTDNSNPLMVITAATISFLLGISPSRFWHVLVDSCQVAILWGIPYLLVRRGCNPDTRPVFVTKYWRDAFYGSLALVAGFYLKCVMKKWLPLLFAFLWSLAVDSRGSAFSILKNRSGVSSILEEL
jgi:hypothetical protein